MTTRRLLATLVLALALPFMGAPVAHAFHPIKKGSHGAKVAFVQRTLHQHVDRIFGPGTRRAVKRFQRRHGLHADGIVGPATWQALKHARASKAHRRHARRGPHVRHRGGIVRLLQRKLGIGADGVFGPATKRAVKRYQRAHGLFPDGVVGPATWASLGAPKLTVILKRGRLRGDRRGGSNASAGSGVIARVIQAANRIAAFPYRYGGGHGRWRDSGYDCSGSVSYALHGGGLLSSPLDSSAFMHWGAPGRGRRITVYANPGHAFMVIDGRRFDTSGPGSTRWQPSGRSTAGYVARHPVGF